METTNPNAGHGAGEREVKAGPLPSAARAAWWFLDTLVRELATPSRAGPVVLEQLLPLGAAPPRHLHRHLDDSWYLLEGRVVVERDHDMWLATAGHWVSVPCGTPHGFRVVGDVPARILLVHNDDSFLGLVRELGETAQALELPIASGGPGIDALSLALLEHDTTVVGDSLTHEQVEGFLTRIATPEGSR